MPYFGKAIATFAYELNKGREEKDLRERREKSGIGVHRSMDIDEMYRWWVDSKRFLKTKDTFEQFIEKRRVTPY